MDSSSTSEATTPVAQPPAKEPVKVITFQKILENGPNAVGMRGVPRNDADPDKRVIAVSWRCGHKKKNGHACGTQNKIQRVKCRECKGTILDYRNIKNDREGRPIQAGDELNMVPDRLKAAYWECPGCYTFNRLEENTVTDICCPNCFQNDEWVVLSERTWVYNKFSERLGSFDGKELVELNPWMDSLWAVYDRINHNRAYTVIE